MIFLAILLQAGGSVPASTPERSSDIVVVGRSSQDTEAALGACIARRCPSDQEIRAALNAANAQFLSGDYAKARHTLLAARRRNQRFAAKYPLEVSDLNRALVLVSNLDGRPDAARISALDATDALKAGLEPDDPLILLQRLETARQLAKEGRLIGAMQIFDDVTAKAHERRYFSVEAQAMFSAAAIYATIAKANQDYRAVARKRIARIESRTEPEFAEWRQGMAMFKMKLEGFRAQPGKRDEAPGIAGQGVVAVDGALLLHDPQVEFSQSNPKLAGPGGVIGDPEWVDVAFWIRPDGTVGDLHVIKESRPKPGSWARMKIEAVTARRYAPLKPRSDVRGIYQVERYTMVHSLGISTGSHIPVRSARGVLETTDVTAAYRAPPLGS